MTTPTTAASPDWTASASAVTAPDASDPWPVEAVRLPTDAEAYGARQSTMANDTIWTEPDLDELKREFADVYGGRTVLVTGADGFMGSHITEALVALGACKSEETHIDATTDVATDTAYSTTDASTTMTTDTMMTDTMSTDTMATDTMSTDTGMTDTSGTSTTSTTSGTTSTTTT